MAIFDPKSRYVKHARIVIRTTGKDVKWRP